MSYKSSEGSTFASTGLSGPPLFGAVGSVSITQYAIPATATATSYLGYSKVLPRGTWVFTATATPSAAAGQLITQARIDVGTNYPAAPVYIATFLLGAAGEALTRELAISGAYYSDGVSPLQVVVSCSTDAGTWSAVANDVTQMIVTKVA